MKILRPIIRRLRHRFRRKQSEDDMAEEMRFHLEQRKAVYSAEGLTEEEAQLAAQRRFGNLASIHEQARDGRGWRWLENLGKDFHSGRRSLVKAPGFTIVALVTLALGIGINTSAFTVLNRLFLQSLPYPEPDRLVQIWSTSPNWQSGPISPGDFCDLRDQNTVFSHLSVYGMNNTSSIVLPGKMAEASVAMAVTDDYFPTLGIAPALGRNFRPEDRTKELPVVILSNEYWQNKLAGDPQVLGRALRFNGKVATIIGVMPPILDGTKMWGSPLAVWYLDFVDINRQMRDNAWYTLIARLKPGVTLDQAQTELTTIAARLAHDYPSTNDKRGLRIESFTRNNQSGGGRDIAWLITALALTVLLIAGANLANLQLARTTGRSQEFAVRLALGASRGRLIRFLLTESLLLSLTGGTLGLMVAKWSNAYFASYLDSSLSIDFRVLGFAFLISTLTGVAFGVFPAWLASRTEVNAALKQGGPGATSNRSRRRFRHALVVTELALTLTLLTGAGYFVYGLQRIVDRDLHWRPENVLTGNFELPRERYGDETNSRHEVFTQKFLAGLRRLPGVDAVAVSAGTAAGRPSSGMPVQADGMSAPPPGQQTFATRDFVSPGYLATYGIRLLQGRDFTEHDRLGTPAVAIINQAMAEKFWPGANPIGKRFSSADPRNPDSFDVVGVVNNASFGADIQDRLPPAHFYSPWAQKSFRYVWVSLHSVTDPRTLRDGVRRTLADIEPDVAMPNLGTAEEAMASNLSGLILMRRTLSQLAGLGLLLATVGIYGVIANLTVERTREIGIRMALGAQPRDMVWLFLRNGVLLSLAGAAVGVILSAILLHILKSTVAIMPGNDTPWMIVTVTTLLTAVTVIACWLPARHATKVDPILVLRAE